MRLISSDKEIVVTGVGVVTPLEHGAGVDTFWNELCRGANAIGPIRGFDVQGYKCNVGAEVNDFELFLEDYWREGHDRCTQLFALACQYALHDAAVNNISKESTGVAVGTILGGIASGVKHMEARYFRAEEGDRNLLKKYCLHSVASSVARRFSLQGPVLSINTACCSGADAIRYAAMQLQNDRATMMIAGGVDILSEFAFRGFSALNALTTEGKVRPFDRRRTGLALGEGAGVVVLEEKSHARERGARIYCTLSGAGSSADACHLVRPDREGEGLSRAMNIALAQASAIPNSIDYICAHGTGTLYNDAMETKSIKRTFKEEAYLVRISSIKSMIGHTLGAASAIEAITCIKAIEGSAIPPTINYGEADPECDLAYVVNSAHKQEVNACMSLSAGFGGQNTALIFKRIES